MVYENYDYIYIISLVGVWLVLNLNFVLLPKKKKSLNFVLLYLIVDFIAL